VDAEKRKGITALGEEYLVSSNDLLQTGSILTLSVAGTRTGTLDRNRDDLTWSQVCKESIGYYVGKGMSSTARCRGCLKQFPQNEVRIKTKVRIGNPQTRTPITAEISICLSASCLNNTLRRYSKEV
jgi:hypothetical protein